VQHPSEVVKKGDTVDVVILNIDSDNKRISLGPQAGGGGSVAPHSGETYLWAPEPSRDGRAPDGHSGVDRRHIGNDIEGFVPVSQLNNGKPVASPADIVYEGMYLDLRVLEVDPIHRRIVLAVTDIPAEQPPRPETASSAPDGFRGRRRSDGGDSGGRGAVTGRRNQPSLASARLCPCGRSSSSWRPGVSRRSRVAAKPVSRRNTPRASSRRVSASTCYWTKAASRSWTASSRTGPPTSASKIS